MSVKDASKNKQLVRDREEQEEFEQNLQLVQENHSRWLRNKGGKQADLSDMNCDNYPNGEVFLPKANLDRVSFCDSQLNNSDFNYAELNSAKFRNSNLEMVNFSHAKLSGVDFTNANLVDANFKGSKLTRANFTEANLQGANLLDVYLVGAKFGGADISGAQLSLNEISMEQLGQCLYTPELAQMIQAKYYLLKADADKLPEPTKLNRGKKKITPLTIGQIKNLQLDS